MPLTEREADVLRDVVQLHEVDGRLIVHDRMRQPELDALSGLVAKGLVELRRTSKDTPPGQLLVVPTPVGRRMVRYDLTVPA
jgi:hypothetical protein